MHETGVNVDLHFGNGGGIFDSRSAIKNVDSKQLADKASRRFTAAEGPLDGSRAVPNDKKADYR